MMLKALKDKWNNAFVDFISAGPLNTKLSTLRDDIS